MAMYLSVDSSENVRRPLLSIELLFHKELLWKCQLCYSIIALYTGQSQISLIRIGKYCWGYCNMEEIIQIGIASYRRGPGDEDKLGPD